MRDDDPVVRLGRQARDLLLRLVREIAARKGGADAGALPESIELRLPLVLGDRAANGAGFARELAARVEAALEAAGARRGAPRAGHAYCHRCAGAPCEHSRPPSCRHVFAGYTSNGVPRWADFAQWCLDRGEPDVDRLYESPPAFLTFVQEGDELERELVPSLRRGTHRLVGQVLAGFYPVRASLAEGRGVVAITVQASIAEPGRGPRGCRLEVLGRSPGGEPLESLWDREGALPWHSAARWAQAALDSVRIGRTRFSVDGEERALAILRGVARRLDRDRRSRSRRTAHAEERHESGERPTRKALDDARAAKVEACRIDPRTATLVVLGARGRTHFFTREGRLVSSVRYSREAIARKIERERWRPATPDDLRRLREGLEAGLTEPERTRSPAPRRRP